MKPKYQQCQQALRPHRIFSCFAVMLCWRISGYSLKSCLQWELHHLRVPMCWVLSPRSFRTECAPSGKPTGWLGRQLHSPRSTVKSSPARKWRHPGRRLLGLHIAWGLLLPPRLKRTVTQEPPFRAGAGSGVHHRPYSDTRKASTSSTTRQRWWVPGGGSPVRLCPALAESAGQLPGHRHCRGRGGHCIPATASAHPSVHQLPDQKQPAGPPASRRCLADKGSHRVGHQRDIPRILQPVVPGPQEDRRSATCNRPLHSQPPHGSSTLQDGDARVCPFSHQNSGVDGIDRLTRCLPSCSDAPGLPQVSMLRGQQESVPVHLSSIWAGDFPTRVHQAAVARRSAVKAARCDDWRLADQSRYSGTGQTARPDNHQGASVSRLDHQLREVRPHYKSRLPVHRDAVQHSTIHSGAPNEDASKGSVCSSALDHRPEHHSQRSAQTSRHVGVHGFAGTTGKTSSSSGPVVGRHIMVPEDRELVRPDPSSSVGSVRGGLVGISSSPARSTPRRQGDGSDSIPCGCRDLSVRLGSRISPHRHRVVVEVHWPVQGWRSISWVVATFNHVGGSFNLSMAATRDVWIIPSFRIWGYVLHVEHISCVITNCGQLQWAIPSLFSIAL